MKTINYSLNEEYYWVKELACPSCHWLSVKKFDEKPKTPFISHGYEYDEGEYYRSARPFTFWKIKSSLGGPVSVEDDHELVKDYITCGHEKRKKSK